MSWLDSSDTSNKLRQVYVKGFVDVSGGNIINRTGDLIIQNDTSLNNRLFVSHDTSLNANLYAFGRTIQQGDVSMNTRIFLK